jgi:hypothetical protein
VEDEEDRESGEEDDRAVDARHDVGCPRQAASQRDGGWIWLWAVLDATLKIPRLREDQRCWWKRVDL